MLDFILSNFDLTQLFCDVDDFLQAWQHHLQQTPQLSTGEEMPVYRSRLSLSEVLTIVIAFHGSGYRNFKMFYTRQVLPAWRAAFPNLVGYTRFVELMPWSIVPLAGFLQTRYGQNTGLSFVDSTGISVCHPCRARQHRVFSPDWVGWGKNGMGWYYGFKLHLVINDRGELLACKLTAANTDDRKPVPDMVKGLSGKLFGDRGYISQDLFSQLWEQGLQLVTKCRRNMKQRLVCLQDKLLLRKRALIESVNDQLKNISQIEHSRHRSPFNFLVNLLAGLVAYCYQPKKPSLDLDQKDLSLLPQAF